MGLNDFQDFDHQLKTAAGTEGFVIICWILAQTRICCSFQIAGAPWRWWLQRSLLRSPPPMVDLWQRPKKMCLHLNWMLEMSFRMCAAWKERLGCKGEDKQTDFGQVSPWKCFPAGCTEPRPTAHSEHWMIPVSTEWSLWALNDLSEH